MQILDQHNRPLIEGDYVLWTTKRSWSGTVSLAKIRGFVLHSTPMSDYYCRTLNIPGPHFQKQRLQIRLSSMSRENSLQRYFWKSSISVSRAVDYSSTWWQAHTARHNGPTQTQEWIDWHSTTSTSPWSVNRMILVEDRYLIDKAVEAGI